MKRLVDLLRVNESRFTAIILGAMTIAAVINLMGSLGAAEECRAYMMSI